MIGFSLAPCLVPDHLVNISAYQNISLSACLHISVASHHLWEQSWGKFEFGTRRGSRSYQHIVISASQHFSISAYEHIIMSLNHYVTFESKVGYSLSLAPGAAPDVRHSSSSPSCLPSPSLPSPSLKLLHHFYSEDFHQLTFCSHE